MVAERLASPVVTTFVPPVSDFVAQCRTAGFWIGGESGYMAKRGLVQIATMGAIECRHIEDLFAAHVPLQAS